MCGKAVPFRSAAFLLGYARRQVINGHSPGENGYRRKGTAFPHIRRHSRWAKQMVLLFNFQSLVACNTATGASGATGKEVEGFAVLAQRQGAKAVVASLWPVADRSTKNLMQEFYQLREAKADVTAARRIASRRSVGGAFYRAGR